jgi:hypothetical protein
MIQKSVSDKYIAKVIFFMEISPFPGFFSGLVNVFQLRNLPWFVKSNHGSEPILKLLAHAPNQL